jgi:putative FmdB family regulatory protein
MPLYTYRCACGEVFDAVRPMSEAGEPQLCGCGQQARRYYRSTPSITFTPEGYYRQPDDPRYWEGVRDKEPRLTCQQ